MSDSNQTYWIICGAVVMFMIVFGVVLGSMPVSEYRSRREVRNWARCAWLAPIWPAVVGWFVSKWLVMFAVFMWRRAWSKGARDV